MKSKGNEGDVILDDRRRLTSAEKSVSTQCCMIGQMARCYSDMVNSEQWIWSYAAEVNWQQQHAITVMRSVNPHVKIELYTRFSDFSASYDRNETLSRFKEWFNIHKNRGYEWSGSVGKDIFVLISHAGYGNISGLAYINVYQKSRRSIMYDLCVNRYDKNINREEKRGDN